jgi:indole-3-glycerol phosphate synthase
MRTKPIACIAEFKRRSPSAGWIREGADVTTIARAYVDAGAAALSVLTDEPFFGGRLSDLEAARATVGVPLLRKDFVVDPYQIVEARAAGADAILLIVAALEDAQLAALAAEAERVGVDVLVETHDEAEIERALRVGAKLIGINHRDLRTFKMDMTLAERMRARIPDDCVVVAESGLRTADDVARMRRAGIDAILVGESLMRTAEPGAGLRALLAGATGER